MTLEDLDTRYREANWLIAKRSTIAVVKALTLGTESLESLIESIADLYELSPAERRKLRPSIAADAQRGVGNAASLVKGAFGTAVTTEGGLKSAQTAYKAGRLGKTLVTLVKSGPKAAQTMAKTGKVAAKSNPAIVIATAAYAVGSTGWLAYHARAFNAAAYELVKTREGLGTVEDPETLKG